MHILTFKTEKLHVTVLPAYSTSFLSTHNIMVSSIYLIKKQMSRQLNFPAHVYKRISKEYIIMAIMLFS